MVADLEQELQHALIVAIAAEIGFSVVFSVRSLMAQAPVYPAIAAAIADLTPRQVGKLLNRCGFVKVDADRDGAMWELRDAAP